jgi:hypothetical protein
MRFARPVQWTLARACDWYTCHTACVNKGYFKGSCYNGVCSCSPRP